MADKGRLRRPRNALDWDEAVIRVYGREGRILDETDARDRRKVYRVDRQPSSRECLGRAPAGSLLCKRPISGVRKNSDPMKRVQSFRMGWVQTIGSS
jgi:hypothetical protein